ncbi:MAG: hypothetical protein GY862_37555 [Gammaproteobacteria bacterium]|nr:hypothetical protein [Gammaproteobacteria bacterium]
MPKRKNDVEKGLLHKGFRKKEGDHHYFTYYNLKGKKTVVHTKTSHTPKMRDIPDNLLVLMAKQCRLNKADFLNLVDCPLTIDEYEKKLNL